MSSRRNPGGPDYVLYSAYHKKVISFEKALDRMLVTIERLRRNQMNIIVRQAQIDDFLSVSPHAAAWSAFKAALTDDAGEGNNK